MNHAYFKDEIDSLRTSSSMSVSESDSGLDTSSRSDTPVSKWKWRMKKFPGLINPGISGMAHYVYCNVIGESIYFAAEDSFTKMYTYWSVCEFHI